MINNNWIFGKNCGLDFSTSPPTPTTGNAINAFEGCASISDSSGNLLMYTDGITIWDSMHIVRASGLATGLAGSSSATQSAIIVPDPGNGNQYYVFTADGTSFSNNHFNGVLINVVSWWHAPLSSLMTLPSTAGYSPVDKITAIQHENCKDFWVITVLQQGPIEEKSANGTIRVFLVDSAGVHFISDTVLNYTIKDGGYMKASPDGLKIAIANVDHPSIVIFPFDKSTGVLNIGGAIGFPTSDRENYGLEFSPNSKFLYYRDSYSGPIYQVDLTGNLTSTAVGTITSMTGAFQLGPDNVIYIAKKSQNSLAAILDPNCLGAGCNFNNAYITLSAGSLNEHGLPNLITSICPDECDCGCTGCNKDSEKQNEELIGRAKKKFNTIRSNKNCPKPFTGKCKLNIIEKEKDLSPCFSFHWGDGRNDQIEEHDTEVFYLTVCNNYNDITYNGLRITKVSLIPSVPLIEQIQIVPDMFVNFDCLEPCTCQTREFAIITRAKDIAGSYHMVVEYCYEEIVVANSGNFGVAKFPILITED